MIQPLRQAGRKEAGQEILKPEETKQREREQQNLDLSSEKLPEEYEARLIFPEYFEDSVENTPARIVCIETHGCGHRYRYCFAGRVFQYRGYDELFPHVQVQEKKNWSQSWHWEGCSIPKNYRRNSGNSTRLISGSTGRWPDGF